MDSPGRELPKNAAEPAKSPDADLPAVGQVSNDGADLVQTTDPADVPESKNYVSAALRQAMSGQPVAVTYTRPYGCSVKYAGEGE